VRSIDVRDKPPPLERRFYDRDPVEVARAVLGKILLRETDDGLVAGRIVETEAYLASDDSACHAARGKTRKNASMFGPPGHAYVYPIHSRHCFNIVTEAEDVASAVLVRAIQPLIGIERMQQRRGQLAERELASGPAKLCEALALDRGLDGWDLTRGQTLWVADDGTREICSPEIGRSARIGVTSAEHLLLRFFLRDCPYVSGPKRLRS
jgi:DNA-3-methyladenine glycosylase